MRPKTALFLGRFQPVPHNGHIRVIQEILRTYDCVIIALGSAQYSRTEENYSTILERKKLLQSILRSLSIAKNRYLIVPVEDIANNDAYVAHVIKCIPHFDVIYSGNSLVKLLFKQAHIPVIPIPKRYYNISNTVLRKRIAEKKDISQFIPKESMSFLRKHHLVS